ncbi:CidA/LrgA family protein [Acinetobacter sp.]|uniref:CidA/LrgA family protein n=1 Tax=Acinetobacter sp. TaxID=472 RepID=UPI0035B01393
MPADFTRFRTAALQIAIILAIWAAASLLQQILHLPVASGILGFFILLFLLEVQWLRLEEVGTGADLLLGELLVFFIPPVVGVIQYQELLMASGWKIIAVIAASTFMVMAASVFTVRMFLQQDRAE